MWNFRAEFGAEIGQKQGTFGQMGEEELPTHCFAEKNKTTFQCFYKVGFSLPFDVTDHTAAQFSLHWIYQRCAFADLHNQSLQHTNTN